MVTQVTAYYVKTRVIEGAVVPGDQAVAPQTAAAPPVSRTRANTPESGTDQVRRETPQSLDEAPADTGKLVKKKTEDQEIVLRPREEPQGTGDKKPLVDLAPAPEPAHAPESSAPDKPGGLFPEFRPNVVYAVGGGMYNPRSGFLSGEAGTYNIASYLRLSRWEGSLGYSIVTPAYESRGDTGGTAWSQSVSLARLHLSLAQAPRPGLLPSLSLGAGYTFTFYKYEFCAPACVSVTGQAHGPHVLARTRLNFPFRVIAEARYQWDLDSDLPGLKTDGFELSFLFPFEI